ncbi:PITH domain-containing protein GA19395 [Orussus abietinus]|uniref:PITH domain-containing protein GA19395 n=1 Tax=Orussus abietinus TaxID=222816 RepID=UPI0006255C80|nr:PITH domain-containing protein GA19395 [Orussus abietinus]
MEHQCGCGAVHSEGELGVEYSLYQKIDTENLECLNEYEEGSGVTVFKPWEDRLDRSKFVESDVDEELLFNVPFTGLIKLKGLIVAGEGDNSHPCKVRLFKNRPHMTFDAALTESDQEFELCRDESGVHEYSIKVVKFSSVHHLTLHFSGNFGAERTRINYIGLKGEWSPAPKQGVVIATYEVRPQVSDLVDDTQRPPTAIH